MRLLDITNDVLKFLSTLNPKQFKQIYTKILSLLKNPTPNDYIKLSGSKDQYRVDCGEYRIVYSFDKNLVRIFVAGKRNDDDVYKKNKR